MAVGVVARVGKGGEEGGSGRFVNKAKEQEVCLWG